MTVKLLTEQYLEFLSGTGSCTGSSESTLVKRHIVGNLMPRLKLCQMLYQHMCQENRDAKANNIMKLKT